MKITKIQTWLVRPRWAFIEISTDAGISGWGEPVLEGRAATVCECIHEMEPYLIGADPMKIEDLWTVLFRGGFYRGGGILMSAISGISGPVGYQGQILQCAGLAADGRQLPR